MIAGRLISIPLSNYCEKARWVLDLAGADYREDGHPPGLHRVALAPYRHPTVPVLVEPGGRVTCGSDRILERVDQQARLALFPQERSEAAEVHRWLKLADDVVGAQARRLFYAFALEDRPLFEHLLATGTPRAQAAVAKRLAAPLRAAIRARFRVDGSAGAEATERLNEVFDRAAARRDGSPYLVADRFTAADLAFAALAAPAIFPPQYGAPLPPLSTLPEPLQALIAHFRAMPTGAAILDLYARDRPQRAG